MIALRCGKLPSRKVSASGPVDLYCGCCASRIGSNAHPLALYRPRSACQNACPIGYEGELGIEIIAQQCGMPNAEPPAQVVADIATLVWIAAAAMLIRPSPRFGYFTWSNNSSIMPPE